jgi:hypothetical protein
MVCELITAKGAPSFADWLSRGAATLYESQADGDRSDSKNHHMFSNVLVWFIRTVLGIIVSSEPGAERIDIQPSFKGANPCFGAYDPSKRTDRGMPGKGCRN